MDMYNWVVFAVPETNTTLLINSKIEIKDFPGRPVVKNTPAGAENVGLISGLGRLRMLQATTTVLRPAELVCCSREAAATRSSPAHSNRRKPASIREGPGQPKRNKHLSR